MAVFYSVVPLNSYSDPACTMPDRRNISPKWNVAIVKVIINTCAFPAMKSEKSLITYTVFCSDGLVISYDSMSNV